MDSGQLKEKGNTFIREKNYQAAVDCYTDALKLDPSNHTILSNRSLAYFRLNKFEEALVDANKCTELAPAFARGHLRKAMALNSMSDYHAAMLSSEKGYELRQSDMVCKDCVFQWLFANQALNRELIKKANEPPFRIPTGVCILSENYYNVLSGISIVHASLVGVSQATMCDYLNSLARELKELLSRFRHKCSPCIAEWISVLPLASLLIPETDCIPKVAVDTIIERGCSIAEWLISDVDSALNPLVHPVVALLALVINARLYTLDCMNIGHHEREVISKSILPLYSKNILNSEEYIAIHLGTIIGLLASFHGRRNLLTASNVQDMTSYLQTARSLLAKLPTSIWEHTNMRQIGHSVLSRTEASLMVGQRLLAREATYHETDHRWEGSRAVCMLTDVLKGIQIQFGNKSPAEIISIVKALIKRYIVSGDDNPALLSEELAQRLLGGAYALVDIGENKLAKLAFEMGECLYFQIFEQKISLGLWSLDEMGSILAFPRQFILEVAAKLAPNNAVLFVNAVIRWKSMYNEFLCLLVTAGLGGSFTKAYQQILEMHKSGNALDQQKILEVTSVHKQEENKLIEAHGRTVLNILFQHNYESIQELLEEDEAVIDYCYVGASTTKDLTISQVHCAIVLIKPKGEPSVHIIDATKLGRWGTQWLDLLGKSISHTAPSSEANVVSHKLCDLLFSSEVKEVIENTDVHRIFICDDLSISRLPLDLLLFPDNNMLFQKCGISLLSSSREILRCTSIALLENEIHKVDYKANPETENKSQPQPHTNESAITEQITISQEDELKDSHQQSELLPTSSSISAAAGSSNERSQQAVVSKHTVSSNTQRGDPLTYSINKQAIIFANPNFDLESPHDEAKSIGEVIASMFSILFPASSVKLTAPLPCTEDEANDIEHILSTNDCLPLSVEKMIGDNATVAAALQVKSPFILHFSTHAFENSHKHQLIAGRHFWASTTSGLVLAGANTFISGKYDCISDAAGTGQLTSLAVCGMNLKKTCLVYLSACSTGTGSTRVGEASVNLAQACRVAGAYTVIATHWPVEDKASKVFARKFYSALCKMNIHPSEALIAAKESMKLDPDFCCWFHWAPYFCIGNDFPLFMSNS